MLEDNCNSRQYMLLYSTDILRRSFVSKGHQTSRAHVTEKCSLHCNEQITIQAKENPVFPFDLIKQPTCSISSFSDNGSMKLFTT